MYRFYRYTNKFIERAVGGGGGVGVVGSEEINVLITVPAILSTGGGWGDGGGWLPSMRHRSHDQPPRESASGGLPLVGCLPLGTRKKRAVRILLECFLVINVCVYV